MKTHLMMTLLALGLVAACGEEDIQSDGADDAFVLDGKTDMPGVEEGTAQACGVIALGNTGSQDLLRNTVHLDKRAATNIVAYRLGADAAAGTNDDGHFDSLAELDAIKYVGPVAFSKMLRYANDHGYTCTAVDLQVLSVSDWHGQLDPLAVPMVGNIGGAPALSTLFQLERRANPNTLTLTAGDGFGATPPLSSFFQDEPAVTAMNLMKFDADGIGNHNFDYGLEQLENLIELADYPFLSANLANVDDNLSCPSKPQDRCIRPYRIVLVGGVKVAIIGVTNPDAALLSKPGNLGTIEVTDPLFAALEARSAAAADGAQVFVLLVHMGATAQLAGALPTGPLIDLANRLDGFDLILGDHTNMTVNEVIHGALVVENKSQGATWARIRVRYDFATSAVQASAEVLTANADTTPADAAIVDMLAPFRTELSARLDSKIAETTGVFERGMNVERLREMPIGDLLADALRTKYGTQLAFVNGGGIRAPLPSSYAPADLTLRRTAPGYAAGPPYDLVAGDAYAVLPFGNSSVTRTVTGTQLWAMCEHGVEALPAAAGFFPQISGFRLVFDSTRAAGHRVVSIALNDGTPVAADATVYTLATSDFLDAGGDGYTMLTGGNGTSRDKMAEDLLAHIQATGTLTPATDGRMADVPTP